MTPSSCRVRKKGRSGSAGLPDERTNVTNRGQHIFSGPGGRDMRVGLLLCGFLGRSQLIRTHVLGRREVQYRVQNEVALVI